MKQISVTCDYCQQPAEMVKGTVIYPDYPELAKKNFWRCEPCAAWVGCHPRNRRFGNVGIEPLGRLAKAGLRRAKNRAHAAFDPIWQQGHMTRVEAYIWLAEALGIQLDDCHIGHFDEAQCHEVVRVVATRNQQQPTGAEHRPRVQTAQAR